MAWETINSSNESSRDNVREINWVKDSTRRELEAVKSEVTALDWKEWFYTEDADWKIKYDMDAVKNYLNWLKDRPYAATKLQANSTPWIMAVQIALESKGFDTGKIDGIFWNWTRRAVRAFQEKWNSDHPTERLGVDGKPWPKTIEALLRELNVPTPTPTEGEPTPTPTEGEPTPTPTEGEPTPTPTEGEPTPTPTEGEPTPTPTEGEPTPTPTEGE